MTEQTLNIPQLVIVALVGFFALRWWFSSSSNTSNTRTQPNRNAVNPAHVDQVAQMFPQLSRREIAWDLQRNGGSVAATTERILSGRALDTVGSIRRLYNCARRRSGQVCFRSWLMYFCVAASLFSTTAASLIGAYCEVRKVHASRVC